MARILNILVPAFLTEYGRLSFDSSRTENFSEIAYVYDDMTTVMSGDLFYDFFSANDSAPYGEPRSQRVRMQSSGGN